MRPPVGAADLCAKSQPPNPGGRAKTTDWTGTDNSRCPIVTQLRRSPHPSRDALADTADPTSPDRSVTAPPSTSTPRHRSAPQPIGPPWLPSRPTLAQLEQKTRCGAGATTSVVTLASEIPPA